MPAVGLTLPCAAALSAQHTDDDVHKGVNYKVKYLGSVEVDFDPSDSTSNQEHAQKSMRALRLHCKATPGAATKLVLRVSVGNMQLSTPEGKVIMRHSTTRIAYSTVDVDDSKLFAYVAMVKGTQLTLAHIFKCKTPKQGYEMTFVAAHAFDLNYRSWQSNKAKALEAASAGEGADVEPPKAWQKKKDPAEAVKESSRERPPSPLGGASESAARGPSPLGAAPARAESGESITSEDRTHPMTKKGSTSLLTTDTLLASPAREPVFLAVSGAEDPVLKAAAYFASIGVQMIEDEEDDGEGFDAPLAPNMLEIGVAPERYNAAAASDESAGYFTVGSVNPFEADSDGDDDEEDF